MTVSAGAGSGDGFIKGFDAAHGRAIDRLNQRPRNEAGVVGKTAGGDAFDKDAVRINRQIEFGAVYGKKGAGNNANLLMRAQGGVFVRGVVHHAKLRRGLQIGGDNLRFYRRVERSGSPLYRARRSQSRRAVRLRPRPGDH